MTRGRPAGARGIPWEALVARCREHPGEWLVAPELASVTLRTVQVIRRRERRHLRLEDGIIRCRLRAIMKVGGRETCTLIIKFDPKEKSHAE